MPESTLAERRSTLLRRLESLQTELERRRDATTPGEDIQIWAGYRGVLHELVDGLARTGVDVTPITLERAPGTANTRRARRNGKRTSLNALLADVMRVRAQVVLPLTLFTQNGCQDSTRVRDCLMVSQVPFIERNVSTDPQAAQALTETGIIATPLVVAGGHALLVTRRSELAQHVGFVCRCPDGGV